MGIFPIFLIYNHIQKILKSYNYAQLLCFFDFVKKKGIFFQDLQNCRNYPQNVHKDTLFIYFKHISGQNILFNAHKIKVSEKHRFSKYVTKWPDLIFFHQIFYIIGTGNWKTEARLVTCYCTAEYKQLLMCKLSLRCCSAWPKPVSV